ncbi:MAG: hypothetical protein NTX25_21385 [Proteobacteria bacterium]|nr:hypothetical protein [Pseudomonadota bacterium]
MERFALSQRALLFSGLASLVILAGLSSCTRKKDANSQNTNSSKQSAINVDILNSLDQYGTAQSEDEVGSSGSSRTVDTGEDTEDLNIVLPQCGIHSGFAVAKVDITSVLDLHGTLLETTLDVKVSHENSSGTSIYGDLVNVEPVNQRALDLTRKFRGAVTNFTTPNNSNFSKDWKGIVCTIRAADHLTNTRDEHNTSVKFYPSIAPAISPIADASRYAKELGDYKFFGKIQATVTATDNPILTVNKVYTGSILVEKIPAERQTQIGLFKGDVAYRVTNRFGSDEETLALGFHLWTEYYIDNGQRAFSGIITNVGDDELRYFAGIYKGAAGTTRVDVSYNKDIKPLITEHCSSCHRPDNSPRLDLSTYIDVKNASTSKGLIGRVLSGAMPPSSALANDAKKLFSAWSQAGFPEN